MRLFVVANFVMACCWKVPRLPALGETLSATDLSIEPGGKGLNVAVAARRLGVNVDELFGVGNDAAADSQPVLLAKEGISPYLMAIRSRWTVRISPLISLITIFHYWWIFGPPGAARAK